MTGIITALWHVLLAILLAVGVLLAAFILVVLVQALFKR